MEAQAWLLDIDECINILNFLSKWGDFLKVWIIIYKYCHMVCNSWLTRTASSTKSREHGGWGDLSIHYSLSLTPPTPLSETGPHIAQASLKLFMCCHWSWTPDPSAFVFLSAEISQVSRHTSFPVTFLSSTLSLSFAALEISAGYCTWWASIL